MRKMSLLLAASIFCATPALAQAPAAPRPPGLLLTSTAFTDGGILPDKYTQATTSFVSPALAWTNVPAGTVSYALIAHDTDAAPNKGSSDVLHWIAFNIPGAATSLPENVPTLEQLPDGTIQPHNQAGKNGYLGPGAGPPVYHHYVFELFALDTKLSLTAAATRPEMLAAMEGHVIGKAALVSRFHR